MASDSARRPAHALWSAQTRAGLIVFGPGSLASLGESVRAHGGRRVLLVTDPGLEAAGHPARALQLLRDAGLAVSCFDGVVENPSEAHVAAGAAVAREHRADFIVGLGGGSSMDCAKGINFVSTNGGRMEDYWGFGKTKQRLLPSIGIPTTAGTGSEAQSYAIIARDSDHRKMACGDEGALFRQVILDPELLRTVPAFVAHCSGIDALSHAVESFVSRDGNPLSRLYAADAWRRLDGGIDEVFAGDATLDTWGEMSIGAYLAGAAIEASMLGAAHACANPLTATFGTVHGVALGVMMPVVIRYNGEMVGESYDRLAGDRGGTELLASRFEGLCKAAGLPTKLSDLGVGVADLEGLAAGAAEQWTGTFNPRPVGEREFLDLYRAAL